MKSLKTNGSRIRYIIKNVIKLPVIFNLCNGDLKRKRVETINAQARLADMIDHYQNLVFSICYKISGDYFAAEDLTQETFLSAFRKFDLFDGVNEKAWICRIATNKSIDYVRSAGRRQVPTEDDFFKIQEGQQGLPEETCLENEIKQRMNECCAKLKPPYNEVAKAYFLEERSVTELAAARNQKIKTIQTQIYRARDMLRKMYRKEEVI